MADRSVKVAIIGAGSAGLAAFREVRKETDDVVLIESGPYGTTCARVGCMPSKLLIAAASAAEAVRTAGDFGIDIAAPRIDGAKVMARVKRMRDDFVDQVIDSVDDIPDELKLRGHARFEADNRLSVDTDAGPQTVTAERIIIATGSRPNVPQEYQDHPLTLTTDDLFFLDDLPRSAAVFGGGIIGLEIGQALARLGVRTKLFGKEGAVGPLTDTALLEVARDHFTSALDFVPHFELTELSGGDGEAVIAYEADGETAREAFDCLLVAIGRSPNVDGLDLHNTSLTLDESGVPQFDRATCQCGDSAIFIAGDVNDELPLLHEASDGGKIAGANALRFPDVTPRERHTPLTVVYCEPQIAMVGQTRSELEEAGTAFVIGLVDWTDQGRAKVMGEAHGRLHVYAAKDGGALLGAEMFGPRSEHLAHLLALAVGAQMTLGELASMPIYHPTFEEGLSTALSDALAQLGLGDAPLPYGLSRGAGG